MLFSGFSCFCGLLRSDVVGGVRGGCRVMSHLPSSERILSPWCDGWGTGLAPTDQYLWDLSDSVLINFFQTLVPPSALKLPDVRNIWP